MGARFERSTLLPIATPGRRRRRGLCLSLATDSTIPPVAANRSSSRARMACTAAWASARAGLCGKAAITCRRRGPRRGERRPLPPPRRWGASVGDPVAKNSVITHTPTGRSTTYGRLAAKAARLVLPDPSKIRIKTPDRFTLMGTEQKNLDVPLKVTGEATFGIDIRLPGMLYAAVK